MSTDLNPAEMVWEDPPRATGRNAIASARYAEMARILREAPDRWAVIAVFDKHDYRSAPALASNIQRGHLAAFREPGFEAVSRTVGDEARVYARYVGTGDES